MCRLLHEVLACHFYPTCNELQGEEEHTSRSRINLTDIKRVQNELVTDMAEAYSELEGRPVEGQVAMPG